MISQVANLSFVATDDVDGTGAAAMPNRSCRRALRHASPGISEAPPLSVRTPDGRRQLREENR